MRLIGSVFKSLLNRSSAVGALIPGVLWLLVTGSATADILEDIVPQPPTDGACWQREYDNDHLSRHPRQKVTELRFLIQPFQGRYDFTIDIATRKRAGVVTGSCSNGPTGTSICTLSCGGGDVILQRSGGDGAILLEIGASGALQVNARCKGSGGAVPFLIEAEPDDKLFLLHPTPTRTCTVQPFKPYLDHRGD